MMMAGGYSCAESPGKVDMRKVAVVTGGSSGVGLETAKRLAANGFHLLLCGRRRDALIAAQAVVHAAGSGECLTIPLDLAGSEAGRELVGAALARYGRIDVLVNSAGFAPNALIESFAEADFEQAFAVNCRAVYATTRAAWPALTQQHGGLIVNISSLAAVDPFQGFAVYGACKAWVNLFTKAIASEGRPHGIRTYALMLGAVDTPMLRGLFPEFPTEQTLQPDEVAEAIVRLLDVDRAPPSGEDIVLKK
jgi:3-oxoacyl-[acyl-carrier protein] reductase